MKIGSDNARDITTEFLDRSGLAFVNGDFEAFRECIALPYELETFQGKRTVDSEDELKSVFDAILMHHRKTGVTQMARNVLEAVHRDENTILATFETRLLNGTILTQAPYPVFAIIIHDGESWKTNCMTFAIEDSPDHNSLLMGQSPEGTPAPQKNARTN